METMQEKKETRELQVRQEFSCRHRDLRKRSLPLEPAISQTNTFLAGNFQPPKKDYPLIPL